MPLSLLCSSFSQDSLGSIYLPNFIINCLHYEALILKGWNIYRDANLKLYAGYIIYSFQYLLITGQILPDKVFKKVGKYDSSE
jgi:hypothetical protein